MMVRCVIYKHNRDLSVINNLFVTHIWTHVCDIYAIETLNPYGVDVASGVESEKGIKDLKKIKRFIENVRR
jgi:hypothetical protein